MFSFQIIQINGAYKNFITNVQKEISSHSDFNLVIKTPKINACISELLGSLALLHFETGQCYPSYINMTIITKHRKEVSDLAHHIPRSINSITHTVFFL